MDISGVVVLTMGVMFIIKGMIEIYHYMNYTVPQQLVLLVKQAHHQSTFHTMWNIQISNEMRNALCLPLTPVELQLLLQAEDHSIRKSIGCYLISHKYQSKKLTGVVSVTIDITSKSGLYDFHYHNVRLQITVSHMGNQPNTRWIVSNVEVLPTHENGA